MKVLHFKQHQTHRYYFFIYKVYSQYNNTMLIMLLVGFHKSKSGWSFYSGYICLFKILLACTHENWVLLFSPFCLPHSDFKTHNPIREVTQHVPYLSRPLNSPDIPGQLFCHLAKLVSGGIKLALPPPSLYYLWDLPRPFPLDICTFILFLLKQPTS